MSGWEDELIAAAIAVRKNAYERYSGFAVGAVLAVEGGAIHAGCNVENAVYGLTICAERAAACAAIAAGQRIWRALALAATPAATPCGACRQFLAEFCPQLSILSIDVESGAVRRWTLGELLPEAFRLEASRRESR